MRKHLKSCLCLMLCLLLHLTACGETTAEITQIPSPTVAPVDPLLTYLGEQLEDTSLKFGMSAQEVYEAVSEPYTVDADAANAQLLHVKLEREQEILGYSSEVSADFSEDSLTAIYYNFPFGSFRDEREAVEAALEIREQLMAILGETGYDPGNLGDIKSADEMEYPNSKRLACAWMMTAGDGSTRTVILRIRPASSNDDIAVSLYISTEST